MLRERLGNHSCRDSFPIHAIDRVDSFPIHAIDRVHSFPIHAIDRVDSFPVAAFDAARSVEFYEVEKLGTRCTSISGAKGC